MFYMVHGLQVHGQSPSPYNLKINNEKEKRPFIIASDSINAYILHNTITGVTSGRIIETLIVLTI